MLLGQQATALPENILKLWMMRHSGQPCRSSQSSVVKSDPEAHWRRSEQSRPYLVYAANYLIDTKSSLIMDVEATRAIRQAKVEPSPTLLGQTEQRFGIRPDWLAVDTAYGAIHTPDWLVKKRGIIPFIPVIDHLSHKEGAWTCFGFEYDEANGQYICPKGFALKTVPPKLL
ncbi:MAG: hypothetical protein ACFB11_08025 [Paracoccaceae bacterium]